MWADMACQVELRHQHFAEATSRIASLMDDFKAKNRAANYRGGGNSDAMDMRAMRSLVQSLPQYRCPITNPLLSGISPLQPCGVNLPCDTYPSTA